MRTLLLIFLFAIPVFAQAPDPKKYEVVADTESKAVFFVGFRDAIIKGSVVTFEGIARKYVITKQGAIEYIPSYNVSTIFQGDCSIGTIAMLTEKGTWGEEIINETHTVPVFEKPEKGRPVRSALDRICQEKTATMVAGI